MQVGEIFGFPSATSNPKPPEENHVYAELCASSGRDITTENATRYDSPHESAVELGLRALTFHDAGRAIRRLRKRRGWTLDEMAAMTDVAKMTISNLERGKKVPRPSSIARLESGLGWKPKSFYLLAEADGDDDALDAMVDSFTTATVESAPALPVHRIKGTEVLTAHVEAYIDMIDAIIDQLPPPTNPRFTSTVNAALSQCAKVSALAANSWRMAVTTDREAATKLFNSVRELEAKRQLLLSKVPESMAARFDSACQRSDLPEPLISVLTGLTTEESWSVRSGGAMPEGAQARIAAFIRSQLTR